MAGGNGATATTVIPRPPTAGGEKKDLKLNSPAGADALTYKWPLQTGSGSDKHDSGLDIVDTIRWVCDDLPEIQPAFETVRFGDIDTTSYEEMKDLCDRYNRAIDSILSLASCTNCWSPGMMTLIFFYFFCRKREPRFPPSDSTSTHLAAYFDTSCSRFTTRPWSTRTS